MSSQDQDRVELGRVATGVPRLDEILNGGIPRSSVVFIAGLPGTGKTILSQQALFANGRKGLTGLYLTTVSEPAIKILRFLQGFTYFQFDPFGSVESEPGQGSRFYFTLPLA